MSEFAEFLHMGGYARYVWSSYGLAALVLAANVIAPIVQARRLRARLARQTRLARRRP